MSLKLCNSTRGQFRSTARPNQSTWYSEPVQFPIYTHRNHARRTRLQHSNNREPTHTETKQSTNNGLSNPMHNPIIRNQHPNKEQHTIQQHGTMTISPSHATSLGMDIKCEEMTFSASRRWVACPYSDEGHTRFEWIFSHQIPEGFTSQSSPSS